MIFPKQKVLRGACALLCATSLPAAAGLFSDADPNWKEGEVALPAAPRDDTLRSFFVSSTSPNKFLLDESSLAVGEDGVVRYVLVVQAAGGARNVTYEGIRCESASWKHYASGRPGGEWSVSRDPQWQPITNSTYNRVRAALATEYICDGATAPRDRAEVLRRLRNPQGADNYRGH